MKKLIDRCKTLCFLDNEKEAVAFAVATNLEQVSRYIEELDRDYNDGEHYGLVKIPYREWQRLVNTLNLS